MSAEECVGKTFTDEELDHVPGDIRVLNTREGIVLARIGGEWVGQYPRSGSRVYRVTHLISLEPVPAPKSETPPVVDVVHGVMFRVPVRTTQGDDTVECYHMNDGWNVSWFLGDNRFSSWRHLGERGWGAHPYAFGSLDEAWAAAWATPEILGER